MKKAFILLAALLVTASVTVTAAFFLLNRQNKYGDSNIDSAPTLENMDEYFSDDFTVDDLEEELPVEEEEESERHLVISSPASKTVTVTVPYIAFAGTCDPAETLRVNNQKIECEKDGAFSFQPDLKIGKNTFSFGHKGETVVYTVIYRYVLIKEYSPLKAQTYPAGSSLVASVTARRGSKVTASFNGKTITLSAVQNENIKDDFVAYNGLFTLPSDLKKDTNLGKIRYAATASDKSETVFSGEITCRKKEAAVKYNANAAPSGGKYINVGTGYIAEVIAHNAETFDGNVSNLNSIDWSRPTNNYLPKGTLDYCSDSLVTYQEDKYVTLRAGYRVYLSRKDKPRTQLKPVVKQYKGTLPDHNEIGVASFTRSGGHTTLTLDCLWKAPFYFDLREQKYANPSTQDYRITRATYSYVDITFCYATVCKGKVSVPDNHPIFSSAKWIKNQSDCTLRLYLRYQGAFYGWDSFYNNKGQLCFRFLEPHQITVDGNGNFKDLNGARILIDVGHGGIDCGATGFDVKHHSEAIVNLVLAQKIKSKLEGMGAVVTLTRISNVTSTTDDKVTMLRRLAPDYCIAIHHNSSVNSSANGFAAFYHHPFSMKASEYVLSATKSEASSIYKTFEPLKWHYYFTARSTVCPVVLTENGYMSNLSDYGNIVSSSANQVKARAIANGIVAYFRSIYKSDLNVVSKKATVSSKDSATASSAVKKNNNAKKTTSTVTSNSQTKKASSKARVTSSQTDSKTVNSSRKTDGGNAASAVRSDQSSKANNSHDGSSSGNTANSDPDVTSTIEDEGNDSATEIVSDTSESESSEISEMGSDPQTNESESVSCEEG